MIEKNQKVIVTKNAPHHANRTGFFQFFGKESSENVAVLADKPNGCVYFSVNRKHICVL